MSRELFKAVFQSSCHIMAAKNYQQILKRLLRCQSILEHTIVLGKVCVDEKFKGGVKMTFAEAQQLSSLDYIFKTWAEIYMFGVRKAN